MKEPLVAVGITEEGSFVEGRFNGTFSAEGIGPVSGVFAAASDSGSIVFFDDKRREIGRSGSLRIRGSAGATFDLFRVTIGSRFHWERKEDQAFSGNLLLLPGRRGGVAVVNEVLLEDYLESVIASEMNASAPLEFLKSHAILSRSWVLAALRRKGGQRKKADTERSIGGEREIVRWYEREDHDLFDVCADDHCQRYHGVARITCEGARQAVLETRGVALTYGDDICDARYSKACGGLTETFETAWADVQVPYLVSVSDGPVHHPPVATEEQAARWFGIRPRAYCNTRDEKVLEKVLPAFDRETAAFFRWVVEYTSRELEDILREKSGFDFGRLRAIEPLSRGPSGRIRRLRIVGSDLSVVVGKELEIRRWLSRSHLYSSAFTVRTLPAGGSEPEKFIFQGAGWGHGVGLCQIGAAVMASRGFTAEGILGHYFPGGVPARLY
jgi:SpoIID/LytB domain protein